MEEDKPFKRIVSLRLAKKLIIGLLFVLVFDFFLFPAPALASEYAINDINSPVIELTTEKIIIEKIKPIINNTLPQTENWQAVNTAYRMITAYNSEAAQCDGSPCITANGFNLCEHGQEDSIAANFLKFGTKVRIPDLFGDKVFIVRDRMNKRYSDRIDIWMLDKNEAKQFGVKIAKIEVLEP